MEGPSTQAPPTPGPRGPVALLGGTPPPGLGIRPPHGSPSLNDQVCAEVLTHFHVQAEFLWIHFQALSDEVTQDKGSAHLPVATARPPRSPPPREPPVGAVHRPRFTTLRRL